MRVQNGTVHEEYFITVIADAHVLFSWNATIDRQQLNACW